MLVKIMKIQLYKHNFTDTPLSLFTVLTTLSWDLWVPGTNNTAPITRFSHRCDDNFHGHNCLPLNKLHRQLDATFDYRNDVEKYNLQVTGGSLAPPGDGCGVVLSNNSLYFGAVS